MASLQTAPRILSATIKCVLLRFFVQDNSGQFLRKGRSGILARPEGASQRIQGSDRGALGTAAGERFKVDFIRL